MRPIYLDHNATTPLCAAAAEAWSRCQRDGFANPSSQHALGRQARRLLEDAREELIGLLGGRGVGRGAERLVFTSGGTEANHLALWGLAQGAPRHAAPNAGAEIIAAAGEHPSVSRTLTALQRAGWRTATAPLSRHGRVDPRQLAELIGPATCVVSIQAANSESGVLQPIPELVAATRAAAQRHGTRIWFHTDAVQQVGRLPVDFRAWGVDALTFAGHKFQGPRGVGGLLLAADAPVVAQMQGGFQELSLRPGTEPVALVVAMTAALREAGETGAEGESVSDSLEFVEQILEEEETAAGLADGQSAAAAWPATGRMLALRRHLEQGLKSLWPAAVIHGADVPRLPQTTLVSFVGRERQALLLALDLAGVACSTGTACASGSSEPSPALLAMEVPRTEVESALRFSFGRHTTRDEIDEALRRIAGVLGPTG